MNAKARRSILGAGVVVVASLLGGCGVGVSRGPTALARAGVPFDLLAPSPPPPTSTSVPPREVPVRIFLLGGSGRLIAVTRGVPIAQETLVTVLNALVDGPTQTEAAAGLQSAIPPQTMVLGASISSAGLAAVDLAGPFGQLVGQGQIEAVAQIVYTATSLSGVNVTGVTFELDGQPIEVPVASGAEVGVANQSQFASLAPEP
jgi:Sporulation and spore germination